MTKVTQKDVEDVLTSLLAKSDAELMALEKGDLSAQWFWRWDNDRSIEWNTYQFSQALETHKWRCRKWEENHSGSCCVVERVRDEYVMPRVREFLDELARHNAIYATQYVV